MMKNTKLIALAVSLTLGQTFAHAASLEDRVAELEANQSLNIFKFNGLLETRYDAIKTTQDMPNTTTNPKMEDSVGYWRHKIGIGIDADVSKYIKFYSKFAMSKYSNVYNTQTTGTGASPVTNQDLAIAKDEKGAGVYVEKAYADVNIADSGAVFSFGRLPTSDGPPFHLQNGRARMGTYPGLLYNAELDGVALTYGKKIDEHSMAFRVVHTPFSRRLDNSGKYSGGGITTSPTTNGSKAETVIALDSAMIEYNNNNISWLDNLNVILQGWQTGNLPVNGSEINAGVAGTEAVEFKIGAQALHIDLENIAKSGFDFSVTVMQSKVENSGCIKLGGTCQIFGFGAKTQGETSTGSSSLFSARYKFSSAMFLGAEYLNGGKTAFVYDSNNDSLTNFYSTTGKATHVYYLHKFTPEFSLRAGYMNQQYDSTPFGFTAPSDSDRKIVTYYGVARLDF